MMRDLHFYALQFMNDNGKALLEYYLDTELLSLVRKNELSFRKVFPYHTLVDGLKLIIPSIL